MSKKQIIITVSLMMLVVIPIFIWVLTSVSRTGTIPVSVYLVPNDASVSIDGKVFKNSQTAHLKPGLYSATVSREGFIDQTSEVIVGDDTQPSIIVALQPSSIEATDWYNDNQIKYLEFEGKVGKIETEKGAAFIEKNPITKWLPLQKAIYSIGYKQDGTGSTYGIIITIRAGKSYRESALQEIRNKGFNPGDYKIEFIDYRSPFDE